jgi:3-methyl-2-oxobutanoate hydroxymethyltransferase
MGHVGLQPQSVTSPDGYKYKGRDQEEKKKIVDDAIAIDEAGAFSIVIEGVAEDVAIAATKKCSVPVIGIGGSKECDGQILVAEDMAGLFSGFIPKFVKRFGNLSNDLDEAGKLYAASVKDRSFPSAEHCFQPIDKKGEKLDS